MTEAIEDRCYCGARIKWSNKWKSWLHTTWPGIGEEDHTPRPENKASYADD